MVLKRKNYWLLFAIILLSLTSLSPSLELNTNDGYVPKTNLENQSAIPAIGEKGDLGVLQVSVSLSEEEFQELQLLSEQYTLSSGVSVTLDNIDAESADEIFLHDLTIGNSPDIVMTDGRNIMELATRGYLLPVDVYQSAPGSAPLTGLIPQLQWNGYDWGVPLDIDPYVLVYSPQMLAGYGADELPRSLEGWDELLQNVRKVRGMSLLSMNSRAPYGYSALLESMGSHLLSADIAPMEWTERARSRFYLTSQYNENVFSKLEDGTLAVAIVPLSQWQMHGKATLVAEAPLIERNDKGLEAIYSRCFVLSAQSLYPEEAVNWLSYVTSSSAQLGWLENTGRLPAMDQLYRTGLRVEASLPFKTDILLTDDTTLQYEIGNDWSEISEAVAALLTSKFSAADYKKTLGLKEEEVEPPGS